MCGCKQRRIKRSRGPGQIRVRAPEFWNAKTTNSDLGRARKSLGATDIVDLNDRRHSKLLSSENKVSLSNPCYLKWVKYKRVNSTVQYLF